jgi:DNA end-binding protein Ku
MPRAVWTGTISFGLVNIGVRLLPATSPKDVRFHLVDERGRRVHYRRFIEDDLDEAPSQGGEAAPHADVAGLGSEDVETGERGETSPAGEREVGYDDLRRGYETDEGVVVLDRDEIEAARPSPSRSIDIEDFVELDDVDPVFFEKSYIVVPQRDAEKPYAVLLRAMEDAGRVGIGRFVLRTKPHLVAIRPAGGVLGLETLFFSDEVRDGRALVHGIDDIEVSEQELQLAETLIDTLKVGWEPSRYADTYRDELLRRIAEGSPIARPGETSPAKARIGELMEALKASVEEAKKAKSRTKRRSA